MKALPRINKASALSTAQIGRCGELLVQFELLKRGIESAPLTTDAGIDLVAYSPGRCDALTIQVKTNLKAKPSGGRGKLHLDWWVPKTSTADLFALVELDLKRVWLFTLKELLSVAQQQPGDHLHFFMATDPTVAKRKDGMLVHDFDFQKHLIDSVVYRIFFEKSAPLRT